MKKAIRRMSLAGAVLLLALASYLSLGHDVLARVGTLVDHPSADDGGNLNAPIERRGVTIELVSADFTSSRTLVTLKITHPTISEEVSDHALFLPIGSQDIRLEGFNGTAIGASSRSFARRGTEQVTLDLPAAAVSQSSVAFEITRLNVRNPGGGYDVVPGPWRIELTPDFAADSPPVEYSIGQQIETSGVRVVLDSVQFASDKTVIQYRTDPLVAGEMNSIGPPAKIVLPDGVQVRGQGGGGLAGAVSFPPTPSEVSHFRVEFGPYLASTMEPAVLGLPFPSAVAELPLGMRIPLQKVQVGRTEYQPYLTLRASSFELQFEPANDSAESGLVAGPGVKANLTDDTGNAYVHAETEGRVSTDAGQALTLFQKFTFEGQISREARELRLQVDRTGVILRGPWAFDVAVNR